VTMEPTRLVEELTRPGAYPHPVRDIDVIQTHISIVFLAGDFVYKVKKAVDFGFLDFTTLDRREHYCHEEIRLNRRLAPDVYLGVVAIVEAEGRLRFDVEGRPDAVPVEWAVRMRRLDEELTLAAWLDDGSLRPYHVAVIGRRVADFHAGAERGAEVARWADFATVAGNARENLDQALPYFGQTLTPTLHRRLSGAFDRELERLGPLIARRAENGIPCDTHGDLHLDHVYVFPDRDPPDDLVIIDCIEFNERFRFADPVADVAFLDMDLRYRGAPELAGVLDDAYFEAAGDAEGRALLMFYSAYRAAVRAKVEGMRAAEPEVPQEERARAREAARAYWLLGLGLLEPPSLRPCLVLVGGLPGTGKSTLAKSLSARAGLEAFSSDVTRKRLGGLRPEESAAAAFEAGIYTPERTRRTYRTMLEEAETRLLDGGRVLVDASFREDARRADFLTLAARLRIPAVFLQLEAPAERVRARIASRGGGPSDADADIYEAAAARWEPASKLSAPRTRHVDTGQSAVWSLEQSVAHLRDLGVLV